ncbi:MAG TPA: hypothetical protein VMT24_04905, partial [Aggregatilineaceae bacterium]|nr:hypothetical protein [Aggregatilineaceae bacterium]
MNVELLSPQDERWVQFLTCTPHDFYHLPHYVEFAARTEGGTAAAFYAETGDQAMLAPLLLRDLPSTLGAPEDW